jgi:endogenous inhibitor of DNA gyrase (YacG/DUF329 family)
VSGHARTKAEKRAVRSRTKCPICGKPARAEFRPFCGNACAEIDLSRWLGGRYAIPGEPLGSQPEADEAAEPDSEPH